MDGGSNSLSQPTVEKLLGTNYQYWKLCMESYLQGQDLWELVSGVERIPVDNPQNSEARRKWKVKCGKAMHALRTSIGRELIDQIRDIDTPKKIWDTLTNLFTKKNTARLQYLENELAVISQGNFSIPEYLLKVKNLCYKISESEPDDPIKEARMRRYLIHGLRKEFMSFITSVQGWQTQPSVILENFLSNQEMLIKQMSIKPTSEVEDVLFTGDKGRNKSTTKSTDETISCHRCGKIGHIKKHCKVKIVCKRCGKSGHVEPNFRVTLGDEDANVVHEEKEDNQHVWEQCFSIEVGKSSINLRKGSNNPTESNYFLVSL